MRFQQVVRIFMATQIRSGYPIKTSLREFHVASMSPTVCIIIKVQAPLHMGAAEFTIHCRLHWEKESITEIWRSEMY
jgi:hypothetical protein